MPINNESVLITGGTGTFGQKFFEIALRDYNPKKLIIFSRDELKQFEMQQNISKHPALLYFLGGVRYKDCLYRAFKPVDIVIEFGDPVRQLKKKNYILHKQIRHYF